MEDFPKIDLFPRLSKLAHFLFDHLHDPGLSDHGRTTGSGPALDEQLYDRPAKITYPTDSEGTWL